MKNRASESVLSSQNPYKNINLKDPYGSYNIVKLDKQ